MPQMSPINWMILFSMFTLSLFINSTKILYFQNSIFLKKINNSKPYTMNISWTW